jgi:hypothetical protein
VYQPQGSAGFESRSDDTEVPRKGGRTSFYIKIVIGRWLLLVFLQKYPF